MILLSDGRDYDQDEHRIKPHRVLSALEDQEGLSVGRSIKECASTPVGVYKGKTTVSLALHRILNSDRVVESSVGKETKMMQWRIDVSGQTPDSTLHSAFARNCVMHISKAAVTPWAPSVTFLVGCACCCVPEHSALPWRAFLAYCCPERLLLVALGVSVYVGRVLTRAIACDIPNVLRGGQGSCAAVSTGMLLEQLRLVQTLHIDGVLIMPPPPSSHNNPSALRRG